MNNNQRWRLPDGVEELLPAAASRLETLRRSITDLHSGFGYELVNPPLIEYLDSLLTGTGETLDLQTFKLVDQLNGKMMGVRADMTPQVARIDSHLLKTDDVNRLFYMGSVLRTRPDSPGGSRSPLQLGAELYGHAGAESDIEIISLMLQTVATAGVDSVLLDLGHVGVYRGLVEHAELNAAQEQQLFDALLRKSSPEVSTFLSSAKLPASTASMLEAITELSGGLDVIPRARTELAAGGKNVQSALDTLEQIAEELGRRNYSAELHIDLTELRGYTYHTGVVFAVYAGHHSDEIARGGRYDDIGKAFGRSRPATGYSTDLKRLARFSASRSSAQTSGIFVTDDSAASWNRIMQLREQGERVVTRLPGSSMDAAGARCDRELVLQDGDWIVQTLRKQHE